MWKLANIPFAQLKRILILAKVVLKNGDSERILSEISSNSIDGVITDPPYQIEFGDHDWDSDKSLRKIWLECFRVLKPGGYLVAFGDHRRFHNTVCELEKIGFKMISGMAWVYPNGTPACQKIDEQHHARVKPSHEPIGLFIKPILEKTYKAHRAIHATAA